MITEMRKHMIKLLDANTIDKIAAGEVIERPMAVVKAVSYTHLDVYKRQANRGYISF